MKLMIQVNIHHPTTHVVSVISNYLTAKLDEWEHEELKKHGDIILRPQPTDSPNDPLNWYAATCT